MADLDHVDMRVEMHAFAGMAAFLARDDVPAGIFVAVARCAHCAHELGIKAVPGEAGVEIVADVAVAVAGRIQRGNADQVPGERDQVVAH